MNLQLLNHLLVLAETGSFTRAAKQLQLSQPTLSRNIQALEAELGQCLVDRTNRRKVLTPLGCIVAARARRIDLELAGIARSSELYADTRSVRLGISPAARAILADSFFQLFATECPEAALSITSSPAEMQLDALKAGAVHALIVHAEDAKPEPGLSIELSTMLRLTLLCRRDHPLLKGGAVDAERLSGFALAANLLDLGHDGIRALDQHFAHALDFDRAIRLRSDHTPELLQVVRKSDSVFVGVRESVRRAIDGEQLVELQASPPLRISKRFALVTLASLEKDPLIRALRSMFSSKMRFD